jgi:predicted nucleotide-binding protein
MARKPSPQAVGLPALDTGRAYVALKKQLEEGERIAAAGAADEGAYSTWVAETKHWVEQSFGENSTKAREFESVGGVGFVVTSSMGPADFAQIRREGLESQLNLLRAFTRVVKQTADLEASDAQPPGPARARPAATTSNKVFVVHGHDDGAKQTVARFLEKLEVQPVILHEQPNGGRTIIEKFEAYADVAFAVVLLTPDDRGGTMGTPFEKQSPRARQNVILELGYFLGRLGRDRVCGLYKEGTEVPSDFQGVLFVSMDAPGAWRLLLGRELKQVIPGVDLNKAT